MKLTMKKTYGDTATLNDDTWSARARIEKLREAPADTFVPPKKAKKVKTK